MSWIRVIDESEATGELKQIYEKITIKRGKVSSIMKVHSLNPRAMKVHMDLYLTLMFEKSGLRREECELIATVVSVVNGCEYCINHHAEALNFYWKDQKRVEQLTEDFDKVTLSEKTHAMLDYVVKLTKAPYEVNQNDIDALRKNGFSDEAILNINLIASYFNFVNRIVSGLGVEFTPDEARGYRY